MTRFACPTHGERPAALVCIHLSDNIGLRAVAVWDEGHERWDLLCERCATHGEPGDLDVVCDICQLFLARGQILARYQGPRPPRFAQETDHLPADVQRRSKEAITRNRVRNLTSGSPRGEETLRFLPVFSHRMGGRLARRTLEALQMVLRRRRQGPAIDAVAAFLLNADPDVGRRAEALLGSIGWEVRRKRRAGTQIRPENGEWRTVPNPPDRTPAEEQITE